MHLLIKPASGACNMHCRYCFYADEMACRETGSFGMMSRETLETVVRRAIEYSAADGWVGFMFQGGEPTLAGLDFYRALIEYIERYNTARLPVQLGLQTNGMLIDDEWAAFFAEHHFLIGLSLDGTKEIHNANRVDARGEGTHSRVMRAAAALSRHGCDFNLLTVVTDRTARGVTAMYNFFAKNGFTWQQYIPCLPPFEAADGDAPLTAGAYGDFLCRLFDLWYADFTAGRYVYNRTFENYIGMLAGRPPESCDMCGQCSMQFVLEADGGVYPCDFYVLDEYRLGNFVTDPLEAILAREREIGFVETSRQKTDECRACRWFPLCRGGCRRQGGRFCEAYKQFFAHTIDRMQQLARLAARR